jgi:hypothetical protein
VMPGSRLAIATNEAAATSAMWPSQ